MRLRSSLRLRPNQIVWASPKNGTLLTGIYAEDHMAARRAEGRATGAFDVYEMHPFLKIDHGTSYVGHNMISGRDGSIWSTGHHDVLFGDLCLTQIPDDFALDDVRICQPPMSRVMVSMYITHFEEIFVNNDDGITFGDIRRAVKEYLSDETNDPGPDFPWRPCKCTTTVTVHELDYFSRWTIAKSPDKAYDFKVIFFDYIGILLTMGVLTYAVTGWENFIIEITLSVALCVWVEALFAFFPLVPSIIVQSKKSIKGPEDCWHSIYLGCAAVTAEEKRTLEEIGVVTADNDPYHLERLATGPPPQRVWRQSALG